MNAKKLSLIPAVVAFVACAAQPIGDAVAQTASPPCTAAACSYNIRVVSCDRFGIYPEYDEIHVATGTHKIHWVITTGGYTFDATDGITFQGNPPVFSGGARVTVKEFMWTDTNPGENKKNYKYNIRIRDSGGNNCEYDPSVVNE